MDFEVQISASVDELPRLALGFLLASEPQHSLVLGCLDRLARAPSTVGDAALAVVLSHGAVVGVAVSAPPPGRLLVLSAMPEGAAAALAEAFCPSPIVVPAVKGPPAAAAAFAFRYSALRAVRALPGARERILSARTIRSPAPVPGRAIVATTEHVELVREWSDAFRREVGARHALSREGIASLVASRALYLWQGADGGARSMAANVRDSVNTATISLVYTPPAQRGRGYAPNCVAALCSQLLASGKSFCCLYVNTDNQPASSVYARLGFAEAAITAELIFESPVDRPGD